MIFILGLIILVVPSLTNLVVVGPPDLKQQYDVIYASIIFKKKPIKYGLANFGVIPFGKTIKGTAIVDDPLNACKEFENKVREGSIEILIATRGECTFVTKARIAQNAGYALILIIDNVLESADQVVLGDDGQGFQIKIPCLIISQADGGALIEYMAQEHPSSMLETDAITLSIDFPTNLRAKATLHLGIDLNNEASFNFLHDLHRFWEVVQSDSISQNSYSLVQFDLIYNLYTCDSCLKKGVKSDGTEANCLGGGLYCSYASEVQNSEDIVEGQQVVLEVVRQLCVLEESHSQWWKYMKKYHKECYFKTTDPANCSQQIMAEHIDAISQKQLDKCVSDSFNIAEKFNINNENHLKLKNKLLDTQLSLIKSAGLKFFPGAIVNNMNFMGTLNGPNVFEEICYSLKTSPQKCTDYEKQGEVMFHEKKHHSTNVMHVVIVVALSLTIFSFVLFFFYRRWAKKRMMNDMSGQVNSMVSNYIQFSDKSRTQV